MQGAKCVYSYDGETIEYCVHSPCPISKTADQIRAEAVKEFWGKLKQQNTMDARIVSVASGDYLVKEMVGE